MTSPAATARAYIASSLIALRTAQIDVPKTAPVTSANTHHIDAHAGACRTIGLLDASGFAKPWERVERGKRLRADALARRASVLDLAARVASSVFAASACVAPFTGKRNCFPPNDSVNSPFASGPTVAEILDLVHAERRRARVDEAHREDVDAAAEGARAPLAPDCERAEHAGDDDRDEREVDREPARALHGVGAVELSVAGAIEDEERDERGEARAERGYGSRGPGDALRIGAGSPMPFVDPTNRSWTGRDSL